PPAPVIGQSTFRFAIGLPPAGFQTAKSISEMLKQSLPQLPLDVTGRITGKPEVMPPGWRIALDKTRLCFPIDSHLRRILGPLFLLPAFANLLKIGGGSERSFPQRP